MQHLDADAVVVREVRRRQHVGGCTRRDGAAVMQQSAWTATVTVRIHSGSHQPLANAVVTGRWNDGSTSSCTTNASGYCAAPKAGIAKKTASVAFTITNVTLATFVYTPADNHELDGDSNGTAITVVKP